MLETRSLQGHESTVLFSARFRASGPRPRSCTCQVFRPTEWRGDRERRLQSASLACHVSRRRRARLPLGQSSKPPGRTVGTPLPLVTGFRTARLGHGSLVVSERATYCERPATTDL